MKKVGKKNLEKRSFLKKPFIFAFPFKGNCPVYSIKLSTRFSWLEYLAVIRRLADEFESLPRLFKMGKRIGPVVQLVRIHACHAWGREFESRPDRLKSKCLRYNLYRRFFS